MVSGRKYMTDDANAMTDVNSAKPDDTNAMTDDRSAKPDDANAMTDDGNAMINVVNENTGCRTKLCVNPISSFLCANASENTDEAFANKTQAENGVTKVTINSV